MGAPLWIMLATFAVMIAALVADRVPAPGPAPPAEGGALAHLGAHAAGWVLVGPDGRVAATNLPERAALLAGACAVLRLASGEGAFPWHTVTLEGPAGVLLGVASPRGAVLAVLARRGAEVPGLRARMGRALAELDRRLPAAGPDPRPGALDRPEPAPGEAFLPLD